MRSTAFGREDFPRDTMKEVKETTRNLKRKAKELNDGIEREITFELNEPYVDTFKGQTGEIVKRTVSLAAY